MNVNNKFVKDFEKGFQELLVGLVMGTKKIVITSAPIDVQLMALRDSTEPLNVPVYQHVVEMRDV